MKLKTKVIITQSIHSSGVEMLEEAVEKVILAPDPSEDTLLSLMDDEVGGIIVRHNTLSKKIIEKATNLKVISRHGIGVELIDVEAATKRGIPVVNTPYAAVVSVAEHTVMMILVLAKKLFVAHNEFCSGGYSFKNTYLPDDIEDMTLGIVGLGNIGKEVAKRAKVFNMNIIAFDPLSDKNVGADCGVEIVNSLDEILEKSDFVTLHTPSNDSTYHMIGKEHFKKMKPSAYFINCSRGEVVNEKDLIEALNNKEIAGAGLDVFEPEPPEKDNPLFKMDNVVLTPHSSALTLKGKMKMSVGSVEQLLKVLNGEEPDYLVNMEVKDIWKK